MEGSLFHMLWEKEGGLDGALLRMQLGGGWMDGWQSSPHYSCRPNCVVSGPAMGRVLAGGRLVGARERRSGGGRQEHARACLQTSCRGNPRARRFPPAMAGMGSGESRSSTGGASGLLCEVLQLSLTAIARRWELRASAALVAGGR